MSERTYGKMAAACIKLLLCCAAIMVHPSTVRGDNWTMTSLQGPEAGGVSIDEITLSAELLWGVVEPGDDIYYYPLSTDMSTSDEWTMLSTYGSLDQIDAGYSEIWGVNHLYDIYKRSITNGNGLGSWQYVQPTNLKGTCRNSLPASEGFIEASVSNDGYYGWALTTHNELFTCDHCDRSIGPGIWIPVDNSTQLIQIEVGDEEVWGLDAANHIFKRPVNGSGEWRSVPGEMRYISASGYRYVWGIAPNDSLYNCEMPCEDGEWQYIGDNFKQIEASNDFIVGLRNDASLTLLSSASSTGTDMPLSSTDSSSVQPTTEREQQGTDTPPNTTDSTSIQPITESQNLSGKAHYVTPVIIAVCVVGVLNLVVIGVIIAVVLVRKASLKRKSRKESVSATLISGGIRLESANARPSSIDGHSHRFENILYEDVDRTSNANNRGNARARNTQSVEVESSFRNHEYSIPNEYALVYSTIQHRQEVSTANISKRRPPRRQPISATNVIAIDDGGYEVDRSLLGKDNAEYEYADEQEFWEPASRETELKLQLEKVLEIPVVSQDELQMSDELGRGQFGVVYRGELRLSDNEDPLEVAVKTLEDGRDEEERVKFLQEAAIMGQFARHPNILRILGIVYDKRYMIVTEIMDLGDLHHYLPTLRPGPDEPVSSELGPILLSYSRQIAFGLMYLSFKKYVHRDLAARNILVSEEGICKIADFGLSRDLSEESYYISRGGKVPVKWTAPEALNYRRYSTASDVWSFGCLLYEIWALGIKPFQDLTNKEVLHKVNSGYRLPPPPGCPKALYKVMIKCWHPEAASRPTPVRLVTELSHPDFQLLVWKPEDLINTSEKAALLGAPLSEGHDLYKELQEKYSSYCEA